MVQLVHSAHHTPGDADDDEKKKEEEDANVVSSDEEAIPLQKNKPRVKCTHRFLVY